MFLNFLFFVAVTKPETNFYNFDNSTNFTTFPQELSENKSYAFEDLMKDVSALRSNFTDTFWQRLHREDSWTPTNDSSLATQPTTAKDNSTLAVRLSTAHHILGTEKISAAQKITGDINGNLLMDIVFPNISRTEAEFQPNNPNPNRFDAFWHKLRRENSWTTKDDSSLATQPVIAKHNSTLAAQPSTVHPILGTEKISAMQKFTGDMVWNLLLDTAFPNVSRTEAGFQPNSTKLNHFDTFWHRRKQEDSWTTKDNSSLATQQATAKDNSGLAARSSTAHHTVGTEKITGDINRNEFVDIAFPNISRTEEEFQPNSTNRNRSDTFWQRRRREDAWTTKDNSSLAPQPTTAKYNSSLVSRPSTAHRIVGTEKISAEQKITGDIVKNLFMDIAFPKFTRIREEFKPSSTTRNRSFYRLPFPFMW